jgi:hypothetical protein
VFVSATDSEIQVTLNLNVENHGTEILEYQIQVSTDGLTYTPIPSYDGHSPLHTLERTLDTLLTGQIYRIRLLARNAIGWGLPSSDLLAAMTRTPLTPDAPTKDLTLSEKTKIAFTWPAVNDNAGQDGGRVTGYRVYMAKDTDGAFVQIFDGKDFRTIVSYVARGLDTGRFYRFKVSAYNFNGEGAMSGEM